MNSNMGLYRTLISIYYSRKNFMFSGFVLTLLLMVYFYLPSRAKHGTHYLNPRMNLEVVKPNAAFLPKVVDKDAPDQNQDAFSLEGLNLKPIPDFVTERSKCPACFGEDLCPEVDSGAIKILVPDNDNDVLKLKGVYNGYWKDQPVVIKRLNKPEEYAKVDAFLCRNASMPSDCDVSKAILSAQGLVQQEKAFHPEFLREAWKIMHDRADKLPVAACITDDAIRKLSDEFDSDHDKVLSKDEKAKFFMSLVFNPESLILAFAKQEGLKIHFPEILGRCGRIVVTEHAGVPLATYLEKPFKERADLAMMLLGMIFFLQNFSIKWSLVFSDFNFDNFYVKDYNLYIVDAEDMLVTDTEVYKEPQERDKTICNHDCMERFAVRLFDYDHVKREEICPLTPGVTEQAMYALACERIMSYLPEHRSYSPFKGLLHDPPEDIREFLETTLRECVSETTKEGRISSVDVLSEMLEKYTDYGNYAYDADKDKDWKVDDYGAGGNLEDPDGQNLPIYPDVQGQDQHDNGNPALEGNNQHAIQQPPAEQGQDAQQQGQVAQQQAGQVVQQQGQVAQQQDQVAQQQGQDTQQQGQVAQQQARQVVQQQGQVAQQQDQVAQQQGQDTQQQGQLAQQQQGQVASQQVQDAQQQVQVVQQQDQVAQQQGQLAPQQVQDAQQGQVPQPQEQQIQQVQPVQQQQPIQQQQQPLQQQEPQMQQQNQVIQQAGQSIQDQHMQVQQPVQQQVQPIEQQNQPVIMAQQQANQQPLGNAAVQQQNMQEPQHNIPIQDQNMPNQPVDQMQQNVAQNVQQPVINVAQNIPQGQNVVQQV